MERVIRAFSKYRMFLRYSGISVFVTVADVLTVWFLSAALGVGLVWANTAGVLIGFVLQYLCASKQVFQVQYGIRGFAVFFGTFLFGLVLADMVIYWAHKILTGRVSASLAFCGAKALSVVIPFFALYALRKYLYKKIK